MILSHPLSGHLTHRTSTRVECASRASLSYQDLGRRRTETTHHQRMGRFESHGNDSAVREWRQRLRACVLAVGGHFEHMLK